MNGKRGNMLCKDVLCVTDGSWMPFRWVWAAGYSSRLKKNRPYERGIPRTTCREWEENQSRGLTMVPSWATNENENLVVDVVEVDVRLYIVEGIFKSYTKLEGDTTECTEQITLWTCGFATIAIGAIRSAPPPCGHNSYWAYFPK